MKENEKPREEKKQNEKPTGKENKEMKKGKKREVKDQEQLRKKKREQGLRGNEKWVTSINSTISINATATGTSSCNITVIRPVFNILGLKSTCKYNVYNNNILYIIYIY